MTKGQGRGLPELRGLGREPEEAGEAGIRGGGGGGGGSSCAEKGLLCAETPLETSAEHRPEHTWDETADARESAT